MAKLMAEDARWAIGELKNHDGTTTLVSWRQNIPPVARMTLGRQFIVEWSFGEGCPAGLPTRERIAPAQDLETLLTPALEEEDRGILAFTCTGSGVREMYFYCADPLELQARLNQVLAGRDFPIQLHTGHDPAWSVFDHHVGLFTDANT